MEHVFALANQLAAEGRPPFASIVLRDGRLVATGLNAVVSEVDPTAHAELLAVRAACNSLGALRLTGCALFTNVEPCLMCAAAIARAAPSVVCYAATREQVAEFGFGETPPPELARAVLRDSGCEVHHVQAEDALRPFRIWQMSPRRVTY